MNAIDEQGRPEPRPAVGEIDTLLDFLEFQRATLTWKTAGLSADELNRPLAPTTMTLGGLIKHLAWVEDHWFSYRLFAHEPDARWASIDWAAHPDWEFTSAADDSPEQLRDLWVEIVERSRTLTQQALTESGPGMLERRGDRWRDGEQVSLRWILVHLIEEYARHNGHADLLREAIDGATGE